MPDIRVLPVHLVNKIAAGEVVERPASVVKELVENALDAGAERIDVAVEDGGKKLIQVADDGKGMSAEDLALAFSPHATSKLADEEDLYRIGTMGFRGEALASVASISHARIRTRRREDDAGWQIEASGETVGEPAPAAAAPGTTVIVRDLFFNTPARRKFMRTANTEFGHVVEQLTRLALPRPPVAFTLTHNGREARNLPAAETTARRAADLFGDELADQLLPIVRRRGEIEVAGLLGRPAAARGSSKWQYVFLNGRYVRDRLLSHAIREAFRGRVDPSRWPVAMVFVEMDPAEVDVNVHPTKVEVRFRNGQRVHGEVLAALSETLNRAELNPTATVSSAEPMPPGAVPPTGERAEPADGEGEGESGEPDADARRESLRQALADFFKSAPPTQPRLNFREGQGGSPEGEGGVTAGGGAQSPPARTEPRHLPPTPPGPEGQPARADRGGAETDRSAGAETSPPTDVRAHAGLTAPRPAASAMPPTLQVHNAYIVRQTEDGLAIIDQHALHERILYNDLRARLAEGRLAGQRLLIPATIKVTSAEAATLEACGDLLGRLGIEVEPFGPETVAVQQFPVLLVQRGVGPEGFLRQLLDELSEDEMADSERLLESVLAVMACKAAVKAGDPLTPAEVDALLARAEGIDKASACPHGRPTTLRMTLGDLEKQFRRT